MEVRDIKFGSPEYEAAVQLREEVLRKPLGMRLNPEDLAKEHSDIHIGVFSEGSIVASVMLRPAQPIAWMKQSGSQSPSRARAEKFTEIRLHARETAVPFYEKLGYTVFGERFELAGTVRLSMYKFLE
ncbi:unnamed protein product [Aphanomyces euteiches]